jgi:hypothetical protein
MQFSPQNKIFLYSHSVLAQAGLKRVMAHVDFIAMSGNSISTAYKRPTWQHILLFIFAPLAVFVCLLIIDVFILLLVGESDGPSAELGLMLLNTIINVLLSAYICARTGFRSWDVWRLFIPIYSSYFSWILWWRFTSLPYAYWEGNVVSQNELRKKIYNDASRRGAPQRLAELTSYAMVPLEDRQRPTQRYATELQQMVVHTTTAIRQIPSNEHLEGVVVDAMQSYALLARDCGEAWYFNKFTSLLTKNGISPLATPAPTPQQQTAPQPQWAAPQAPQAVQQPATNWPAPQPQAQPAWGAPAVPAEPVGTFPVIPGAPAVTPPPAPAVDANRPSWMPPQP